MLPIKVALYVLRVKDMHFWSLSDPTHLKSIFLNFTSISHKYLCALSNSLPRRYLSTKRIFHNECIILLTGFEILLNLHENWVLNKKNERELKQTKMTARGLYLLMQLSKSKLLNILVLFGQLDEIPRQTLSVPGCP